MTMRITREQLRRIIQKEARALNEGAVPSAGRMGKQIETVRDKFKDLGSRVSLLWYRMIKDDATTEMLDTDFNVDAFLDQLHAIDDQLAELMIALYDVDS